MTQLTPVIDGHNDLPWALRKDGFYDFDKVDIAASQPQLHTDLARLRAGGVRGQFWSVFVPSEEVTDLPTTGDFFADTCEQIDAVHRMVERYPEDLQLVTTADQLDSLLAKESGPIASMMGAEGGHSIDDSLGALRSLHRLGVRYLTLTHNDNNNWADSATDEPRHDGLSDFGKQVVAEMNRIGMMVDLSHVAPSTMRDALEVSRAPVIFSHSSAYAVNDHPRNVPDDVLTGLAAGGGICMVTFVTPFVSPAAWQWQQEFGEAAKKAGVDPHTYDQERERFAAGYGSTMPAATIDDVVAHCEHVREVAGIDHIGVGGDFDGTSQLPEGLDDVSTYPRLTAALAEKGWSDADLVKLGSGNIARVFRAVEQAAG